LLVNVIYEREVKSMGSGEGKSVENGEAVVSGEVEEVGSGEGEAVGNGT
jgi:hypothetical protein